MSSTTPSLISSGLPPLSPSAISVNKNDTRYCSQCKHVQIPADQSWKRCLSCREKSRSYRKRVAATRAALANLEIPNDDSAQPLVNGKRKERTDEDTSDRLGGMKKKMRKIFQDKPSTVQSLSHESRDSGYTRFITATDMYKALKSSRSSSMIQFRGSFSIVAVDEIDHERRERLVVEELRKIAKWSFAHDKPVTIKKGVGATTDALIKSVSVSYKCTCHKNKTAPRAEPTSTRPNSLLAALATGAAPAPAPLKSTQSDLTAWMGKNSSDNPLPMGAAGAVATARCKGRVSISVEEDNSHPVNGIKGQKISIRIKH